MLQRAQRKRARPAEQRDVVVTAFPALPAGTPIQLTAMAIGEGPSAPSATLSGLLVSATGVKTCRCSQMFGDALCLSRLLVMGPASEGMCRQCYLQYARDTLWHQDTCISSGDQVTSSKCV